MSNLSDNEVTLSPASAQSNIAESPENQLSKSSQTTAETSAQTGQFISESAAESNAPQSESAAASATTMTQPAETSVANRVAAESTSTASAVATTSTQAVDSTITVSNPANYPTDAAKLVDKNALGEPYYIYQIVKLDGSTINGKDAHLILSVDTTDPQGTNYLYVTDASYTKSYQKYIVRPNEYVDITVSSNGSAIKNPQQTQVYRVSNTGAYTLEFNGKEISVPASVSIKSYLRVTPVYGLGNQNSIHYTDKVDISPENNAPAIEYIYLDKDGNYTTSENLPANVPVNGITGQQFVITNVDSYKQVLNGYYLTNQQGSLANTANGAYEGTISQFQIGQYYQKTLYDWDRNVSQTLIYELIDPQGTMNISLLRPGQKTETVTVPVNEYKTFSNGTLARNPFVPGANSVQLIYADLGKIIPVDENGNPIAGADQPIYNNDPNDPHKAGATQAPDLTALGWVLADPTQATIIPGNPGADTLVQYRRVVVNTEEKVVTQTVEYKYADGITQGRPVLPQNVVQSLTFTHTVITNPVTGKVISDTWTPAGQFTAVASPEIEGFWADQKQVGGNDNVTHETPSTAFTVLYAGPNESTEEKTVTQTVRYEYLDGVTDGRPELPKDNVQTLTFTATIQRNPETGEIISTTWSPAQNFTLVDTPKLDGYYYSDAKAGSIESVTHESGNTEYIVYYAAPTSTTEDKVLTQTVHYQYADGNSQGRPELPKDNVQYITFTQTTLTNPFNGNVVAFYWTPTNDQFELVQTPTINGFYADIAVAGSNDYVVPEDSDTYYVVNYAAPVSTIAETKDVTQTIRYEYLDGVTENRPALPQTDVQKLVFNRVVVTNPYTNEVISDTWSPAQNFTALETPVLAGFYYDLAQAGSNAEVTHESGDTEYVVKYAPAQVSTTDKTVTQTIKYQYADGVTTGRPVLPQNNVQTLTFTQTTLTNPFTGEVLSSTWSPAQNFTLVTTPELAGLYYDLAQAGSTVNVTHESGDTEYVVNYAPATETTESKVVTQTIRYHYANGVSGNPALLPTDNVQQLEFTRTILTNPFTGEVINDTWSPAQNFTVITTPTIAGYYYDQAQAGNTVAVTHESPNKIYDVYYLAPDTTSEIKTITQTIKYEYVDGVTAGRPTLPQNNIQNLTFTQIIVKNPITGEIVSTSWSPAQSFTIVNTPELAGFYYDIAQAGSNQLVTHEDANTEYVVRYAPAKVVTEEQQVTQNIKYEYADGVTAGRPLLPENNVQKLTFTHTVTTNPFTNEVISDEWTPAQSFSLVDTPILEGFYYDMAQAGSSQSVTHDSANTEYVVKYAPARVTTEDKTVTQTVKYQYADGVTTGRPVLPQNNIQTLTFTQTTLTNPFTGEVLSSTWSPAQNFTLVTTPELAGFYYDLAQAGSTVNVTHESGDTEYVVNYAAPNVTTETEKVTQNVKYEYEDGVTEGRPSLPDDKTITVEFTHTVVTNPWTGEVIEDKWSPDQTIEMVKTPEIAGFHPDQAEIPAITVSHTNENINHVVKYVADEQPVQPEPVTPEPDEGDQKEPTIPEQPIIPADKETPVSDPVDQPKTEVNQEAVVQPVSVKPLQKTQPVAQPATMSVSEKGETTDSPTKENQQLPQTGEQNSVAITALGLLAGVVGLLGLGLGKRKTKN
ncbi:mucin-binding protein [Limosilactobacillus albertensis]|uniref:mucin-binding protein n=1 Tax=Limosilactobacillus albertensis TaxID=2759752 RepID=UPI001E5C3E02|nr:LPXTG cell wall anchor domain-containing protein [Limosilactobacillus albertensis]